MYYRTKRRATFGGVVASLQDEDEVHSKSFNCKTFRRRVPADVRIVQRVKPGRDLHTLLFSDFVENLVKRGCGPPVLDALLRKVLSRRPRPSLSSDPSVL